VKESASEMNADFILHPSSFIRFFQPSSLVPRPSSLVPRPSTLDSRLISAFQSHAFFSSPLQPSAFSLQPSAFSLQPSAFSLPARPSTLDSRLISGFTFHASPFTLLFVRSSFPVPLNAENSFQNVNRKDPFDVLRTGRSQAIQQLSIPSGCPAAWVSFQFSAFRFSD
jgi:hypothetical protein